MLEKINISTGQTVAWLALAMVVVMAISVLQRYLFASNHIWQQEIIIYMHCIMFLCSAGYTLADDKHVRVDILYERFSQTGKDRMNAIGGILFLIPVCLAIIYLSYDFVISSWSIAEKSREADGLPAIFLLKSLIWIFAAMMIIQSLSAIIKYCKRDTV